MAPVPGYLQQIPPLQNNVAAIEPWHLDDMSILEIQRKYINKYIAEHAKEDEESKLSTRSIRKRSILCEDYLEWYFEDLMDEIAGNLVKRGNAKDKLKDAADKPKDAAESAADNVKDFIDDAGSKFKDAADKAAEYAAKAEDKADKVCGHCKDGGSDAGSALSDEKDAVVDTVKNVKDEMAKSNRRKQTG